MRILVVDDHELVRSGIRSVLASQPTLTVCGEAVDGREAVEKTRTLRPDVVVMDISMPNMNGLEATREIKRFMPQAEIVIVSQHETSEMFRQAFKAGARGYVVKSSIATDLLTAITKAGQHETFIKGLEPADSNAALDAHEILQRSAAFERALRESEERFRSAMNNMAEGLYTVDARGLVTYINPSAAAMFGWSADELLGKKIHDVTHYKHPDGSPFPAAECSGLEVLQKGKELREHEDIFIRKDGSFFPVVFSAAPIKADGAAIGVVVCFRDDTKRRETEEALRLRAAIVDSSDDAIISKDLNGTITSWNRGAELIFGYSAEEAVGQHITLIIPFDRRGEETMILHRIKRGEPIEHYETVRVRKDRKEVDISLTISPIKDATGRVIAASKVARDISERKRAEKALSEGTRQQKALFDLADQLHHSASMEQVYSAALIAIFSALQCDRAAILRPDERGVTRFVSSRGLSDNYRRAIEGHPVSGPAEGDLQPLYISDIDGAKTDDSLRAILKSEGIRALAFIPLVSNRKLIGKLIAYFDSPHSFSAHEIEVDLTIARQLTFGIERRRGEEQLRELAYGLEGQVRIRTQELEQRNMWVLRQSEQLRELSNRLLQAQDDERRHIARELHDSAGQTLTALGMGVAQLVQKASRGEAAKDAEEVQQLVQQLNQEIRTTSYLLHPPLLDESGLRDALVWYLQGLKERGSLDIELDFAEDFGRLQREMELMMFRLVQECLTNVHRHSGSKTAAIRIARKGDDISLEVQDQGKGMPQEKLAEILSHGGGVGIRGMRERVRHFRGVMEIQSDAGAGTKISIRLPVTTNRGSGEHSVLQRTEGTQ